MTLQVRSSRGQRLLLVMAVMSLSGLAIRNVGAATSGESALLQAHASFVLARVRGDTAAMARMIETFARSEGDAEKMRAEFFSLMRAHKRAGMLMQAQAVRKIEHFVGLSKRVSFLRVKTIYKHPMFPAQSQAVDETVVAFSGDEGRSWRFNVIDCLSEEKIATYVQGYVGKPPLEESPLP